MPGNFANTYFANQLALRNAIIGEINEIDTGRIINVISAQGVTFNIDDDSTPNNYDLYIPAPGILQAATDTADNTTNFVLINPKNVNVELRVANWFTGPTPYISDNPFPDFTSQSSSKVVNTSSINVALYQNPSNPAQKAWFIV